MFGTVFGGNDLWHRSFGWRRLSFFLQMTLSGHRRETHRGSPRDPRSCRISPSHKHSETGGFEEGMTLPVIMPFPEICFWSQGQDHGGLGHGAAWSATLSHSCNPQADVKQLQQRQPWQNLCSSPQLHYFSPHFCSTGVGGLCQHRCCPDASAVRETPGNRSPMFIHL